MIWSFRDFEYQFPRPALLMGIVNVTPDSFSDGGRYLATDAAVAHALELVSEGADLLDIGGESTRPHAEPVAEEEELRRVLPVIRQLAGRVSIPISIDTRKPRVARAAIEDGATVVNDIAANRSDEAMGKLIAESGAGYIAMHMQGTPGTMQTAPQYVEVVREVGEFFADRLERLHTQGVALKQVVLDPGIGFGKTLKHNLQLLANLASFRRLERPVMVGLSRKSFIGGLLGTPVEQRLPGSLAGAAWAVTAGVELIRTHDVAATRQAVRLTEALKANRF